LNFGEKKGKNTLHETEHKRSFLDLTAVRCRDFYPKKKKRLAAVEKPHRYQRRKKTVELQRLGKSPEDGKGFFSVKHIKRLRT